ncbi:MAG: tetratricopeptide repeat protein [Erythrobacter sp.]|jgi:tetratricopeptide (TPR) repeat protein|nr:tetratricopeptide repeat protein [Erythrobacter sp.]
MKGRILACAVLALANAGCSFPDFEPRSRVAEDAIIGEYFVLRLEAGRQHLKEGRLTKAIEAFRQASYNPGTAPEALNGMGVAYTMLGRHDVARDLFVRAINQDPADQRFWRNLARVDDQIMLATKSIPPEADADLRPVEQSVSPSLAEANSPVPMESSKPVQAAALKKAKVREVFITTAATDRPDGVTKRQASGVSIVSRPGGAAAGRVARSSEYPIRIELEPSKGRALTTQRPRGAQSYPIRIALESQ